MTTIIKTGRYLLAAAVTAFGIEQFIFRHPLTAFIPMNATAKNQMLIALIVGILFIAAGIRIVFNIGGKYTAWFPPALFFMLFLLLHLPVLLSNFSNGGEWTVCFELIAISSGALLAVSLKNKTSEATKNNSSLQKIAAILFAISLIVFSGLHFIYAEYIATLIPHWIPFPLFWAYFFGVAFIATAASILLNLFVRLSTNLLAAMFFLWVIVLHFPRCMKSPQTEAEWTSLFVALAIGSIALLFAGVSKKKQQLTDTFVQKK